METVKKMKLGKTFKIGKAFYLYRTDGLFWVRFFGGCCFHGKDIAKHPLLFSERNGYTKFVKAGNWIFKIMKP
jgi:hypothetical protein